MSQKRTSGSRYALRRNRAPSAFQNPFPEFWNSPGGRGRAFRGLRRSPILGIDLQRGVEREPKRGVAGITGGRRFPLTSRTIFRNP